jgi:hypothetical protein
MKRIGLTAVGAVIAGGILLGGGALANAASSTPTPGASSAPGGYGDGGRGGPGGGGPAHAAVTGDELAKVTAAMKVKDASVTVSRVTKDPDGSYDVFGTSNGNQIKYEVSADLATFTQGQDGTGPGGPGGPAVTGDELAKVTAAVKAKDASIAVSRVTKDPDGSYDVFGTSNGNQIKYDVSADLSTVTIGSGGPSR